jgi:hypothetical protein
MLPAGRASAFVAVLVGSLLLVGCSGDEPAPEAVFHVQKGVRPNAADQPCQLHQSDVPTRAFRGGPDGVTALTLPFLASYTANGNKPYCDGKPATDVDKDWARLYVQLTGNSTAVEQILSR